MFSPWWIIPAIPAGFILYDQVYARVRRWQADNIKINELHAQAMRYIPPTDNGQLGAFFDGNKIRNLDDHSVLTMTGQPLYIDELLLRMNRAERLLLAAAQGRSAPQSLVQELEAELPQTELDQHTLASLMSKYAFTPSLRNIIIGEQIDPATNQVTPLTIDIPSSVHILCTGASGLGKSTLVEAIVLQLATIDNVSLAAIDYGSGTFDYLSNYLSWTLADTPDLATALIRELLKLCADRKRKYESVGRVRSLQQYNIKANDNLPFVVLVIDETAPLMKHQDTKNAITELLQLGRKYGVGAIAAGTDFKADTLPTEARGNCQARIAFWLEPGLSRSLLNSNAASDLEGVGDICMRKPGQPGLIYGHTPNVVEGDYSVLGKRKTAQVKVRPMPEDDEGLPKEDRVRAMHARGESDTAIARKVFGHGTTFYINKVRDILADVVVVGVVPDA